MTVQHYTDKDGFHVIGSQPTWRFVAAQPPGDHPFGTYFTTLGPDTLHLAKRLRIPRTKLGFRFEFTGQDGLEPLEGGRGAFIFLSRVDYLVERPRQVFQGETGL